MKDRVPIQPPTISGVLELCRPHVLRHDIFNADRTMVTSPGCLWVPEHQVQHGHLVFGKSTPRDTLPHDHRCRSATDLHQLALRVDSMLRMIDQHHRTELSTLRMELAQQKKVNAEWNVVLQSNKRATPSALTAEVASLRMQLQDVRGQKHDLEKQLVTMRQQTTSIYWMFHEQEQLRRISSIN